MGFKRNQQQGMSPQQKVQPKKLRVPTIISYLLNSSCFIYGWVSKFTMPLTDSIAGEEMLSKTALKWSTTCLLRLLRRKLAKSFAAASNPVVDLSKNAETKSGGIVFDLLLWWKQTQKKQTKKEIRRIGTMRNMVRMHRCTLTSTNPQHQLLHLVRQSMTSLEIHRSI